MANSRLRNWRTADSFSSLETSACRSGVGYRSNLATIAASSTMPDTIRIKEAWDACEVNYENSGDHESANKMRAAWDDVSGRGRSCNVIGRGFRNPPPACHTGSSPTAGADGECLAGPVLRRHMTFHGIRREFFNSASRGGLRVLRPASAFLPHLGFGYNHGDPPAGRSAELDRETGGRMRIPWTRFASRMPSTSSNCTT